MPIALFFNGVCVGTPDEVTLRADSSMNPPPGACNGLAVSLSALIWGHGRCCHVDRRQSRWRVGQRRLMLVVVFFLCFVFCVLCFVFCVLCFVFCVVFACIIFLYFLFFSYPTCKYRSGQRTNKQTLCSWKKATKKTPRHDWMFEHGMIHTGRTEPRIDARVALWHHKNCAKVVLQKARFS